MRSDEDDMITLNGGVKWQFPKDMEFCPECGPGGVEFNRSELIAHFKRNHASYTTMCQLCNQTISIQKDPNSFIKHYKEVHPDIEPPSEDNETVSLSFFIYMWNNLPKIFIMLNFLFTVATILTNKR